MLHNPLIQFSLLAAVGLLIMLIGLRTGPQIKRILESLGAVIFHIGVFGILYQKVSLVLFISLVALVLSLFILIDPLKFAHFIPIKAFRATGLFLLFMAIAFSTLYFTNYPLWLWVLPLLIYFLPYVLPPLKRRLASLHFFAWLLVLINVSLITYALYSRLYPEKSYHSLVSWFDKTAFIPPHTESVTVKIPAEPTPLQEAPPAVKTLPTNTPKSVVIKPAPTSEILDGPFLRSLHEADEKFLTLKKNYEDLQKSFDELKAENERLKNEQDL